MYIFQWSTIDNREGVMLAMFVYVVGGGGVCE